MITSLSTIEYHVAYSCLVAWRVTSRRWWTKPLATRHCVLNLDDDTIAVAGWNWGNCQVFQRRTSCNASDQVFFFCLWFNQSGGSKIIHACAEAHVAFSDLQLQQNIYESMNKNKCCKMDWVCLREDCQYFFLADYCNYMFFSFKDKT